jgi:hypothetical protein
LPLLLSAASCKARAPFYYEFNQHHDHILTEFEIELNCHVEVAEVVTEMQSAVCDLRAAMSGDDL